MCPIRLSVHAPERTSGMGSLLLRISRAIARYATIIYLNREFSAKGEHRPMVMTLDRNRLIAARCTEYIIE
jgi:hypothetical protein